MGCDLNGILLAFTINNRSNLFLGVLGELLEASPLTEEFLSLLDLLVLADVVLLKELKSFVELVKVKHRLVILFVNNFHAVLDSDKGLYICEIFSFGCTASVGRFHEVLHVLDLFLNVLHHSGTGQMVVSSGAGSTEASFVGRSSQLYPLFFVVLI